MATSNCDAKRNNQCVDTTTQSLLYCCTVYVCLLCLLYWALLKTSLLTDAVFPLNQLWHGI